MAYKFQLGAFTASGSIKVEEGFDAADTLSIAGAAVTSTAAELNKLDGADVNVTAAKLSTLSALTNTEVGYLDGAVTNNSVASKVAMLDGSRKLLGITELSASGDVLAYHSKARQLSLAYDGSGGAEGHIKLGAGGDMQLAVFSDDAFIMNNTVDKDIKFQVKKTGGSPVSPLVVDGSDHSVVINKLSLSGTLVTAVGNDVNLLAGAAASGLSAAELMYVNGVTSAIQGQIDGKSPVAGHASIATVGTLDAGAISANFGAIDNGDSNITSGGILKIDKDLTSAPASAQTVAGQAGSLTLGVGAEGAIGVKSDVVYIESNVDEKKISFRTRVGSDMVEPLYIDGAGIGMADDKGIVFGTDDDVSVKYDAAASNTLLFTQNVEGAALNISYAADQHDDAGDAWAMSVAATGGKKSWMNDIASKGTMVEHFSITPNANAALSTAAFAGHVTAGGNLTVTGDLTINGTTTTINSTVMSVDDRLIRIGDGLADLAAGVTAAAGFEIGNNLASFKLDTAVDGSALDGFASSLPIKASAFYGALTGNVTGNASGNAGTATALATARAIGGVNFDGSAAITPREIDIADDESTNSDRLIMFAAGVGAQRPMNDGDLKYNPSTGMLTATKFSGTFEGTFAGTPSEKVWSRTMAGAETYDPNNGHVLLIDVDQADRVLTLPAANDAGVYGGGNSKIVKIKRTDTDANKLTIHAAGNDRIDGGSHVVLESAHAAIMLVSDGSSKWFVM